jgi:hypothetical protein
MGYCPTMPMACVLKKARRVCMCVRGGAWSVCVCGGGGRVCGGGLHRHREVSVVPPDSSAWWCSVVVQLEHSLCLCVRSVLHGVRGLCACLM